MCIICVDFARGALKVREARRALGEMAVSLDPEHVKEIEKRLAQADDEEPPTTPRRPRP